MLSCFPDFLHVALEEAACAVFFEENRMEHATSPSSAGNPGFSLKRLLPRPGYLGSERLEVTRLTGELTAGNLHKKRDSDGAIVYTACPWRENLLPAPCHRRVKEKRR
jgi:hypothetical protein